MDNKTFKLLFDEALRAENRETYVSDRALSSVWNDAEDSEIPAERIDQLGQLWDVAHMSVSEIRAASGLNRVNFAARYGIPLRTVENWETAAESNSHTCPPYTRLLLAMAVGCYGHP